MSEDSFPMWSKIFSVLILKQIVHDNLFRPLPGKPHFLNDFHIREQVSDMPRSTNSSRQIFVIAGVILHEAQQVIDRCGRNA